MTMNIYKHVNSVNMLYEEIKWFIGMNGFLQFTTTWDLFVNDQKIATAIKHSYLSVQERAAFTLHYMQWVW